MKRFPSTVGHSAPASRRSSDPRRRWLRETVVALLACAGLAASGVGNLSAATLNWDPDGTADGNFGGSGTWDTNATVDWTNTATNTETPWTDTTGVDTAVFTGTAGTVTLAGTETANKVNFLTTGYMLTGGTLNLAGTAPAIAVTGGVSATIASNLTGTTALAVNSAGTTGTAVLTLSGNNVGLTGGINMFGATGTTIQLNIGSATALGTGTLTIGNNGSVGLAIDNSTGAALTLTTNNQLVVTNTFNFVGTNDLNLGTGGVTFNAGKTIGVTASTLTIGGVVSGANGFTKGGAGTLLLTNSNTLTGGIVIGAGTVQVTQNGGLGTGTLSISKSGVATGELLLGGGLTIANNINTASASTVPNGGLATIESNGNNTLSGNITVTSTGGNGANILSNSGTLTLSGTLTGTAGGGRLFDFYGAGNVNVTGNVVTTGATITQVEKDGTGTLILSGTNTYAGTTVVNAGTLVLSNSLAAQNSAVTIATGAALVFDSSVASHAFSLGGLTGVDVSTDNGGNAVSLTIGGGNNSSTYANVFSGSGSLTKVGTGTLTLGGNNTYTGATSVTGGNLVLDFTNSTATTDARINPASRLVIGGSNLTVNGASNAGVNIVQSFASTQITNGVSTIINNGSAQNNTTLNLGAITRTGNGTVDFSPTSSQTAINTTTANTNGILGGWATVNGTDWATNAGGLISPLAVYETDYTVATGASNFDVQANGTFSNTAVNTLRFSIAAANAATLNGAYTVTSGGILVNASVGANLSTISGGTSLTSGNGRDLVVNQNNASGQLTIATPIVGNIGLTKTGAGTLSLDGANTYTGPTFIGANSTLVLNNAGSLGASPSLTFVSGGTLVYGTGITTDVSGLLGSTSAGTLNISTTGNTTYASNIGGSVGLAKFSGGALTLSGNNTFTGGVSILATTALPNVAGNQLNINSPTALGTGTFTFGPGGTITFGATIDNTSGSPITLTTNNPVVLNNSLVFAGTNNLTFGTGSVTLPSASRSINVVNGTLAFNGPLAGTNGFIKAGVGTLQLNATGTVTGTVTVPNSNSGVLMAAANNALGTGTTSILKAGAATSELGLTGGITLSNPITASSATLPTFVNGTTAAGGFASIESFSGNNALTGGITLNAGGGNGVNFLVDAGSTLTISGAAFTTNQTGRISGFNGPGNAVVSSVVSGGQGLQKDGTGNLTLTGTNTYTGGTLVDSGTVIVNGNNGGATGAVAIRYGFAANTTAANSTVPILSGTGTIGGATTIGGTVTFGSNTTNGNGILAPGANANAGTMGLLTFASNLTLSNDSGNGSTTISGMSTVQLDVGPGAIKGTNFDNITLSSATGVLTYAGALTLNATATLPGGTDNLFTFTAAPAGSFAAISLTGAYGNFALTNDGAGNWTGAANGQTFTFAQSSGNLVVSAVPEPGTLVSLAGGGLMLLGVGWQRKRARGT